MKVFYHGDADGRCAGRIIAQKCRDKDSEDFIEMQYGNEFPFHLIKQDETVYIVDYSIEPEEMKKLLSMTPNVIWIDHHVTAIQKYKDFPRQIGGIRKVGVAGCVLTWIYLHDGPVPMPVKYIGDRDVWDWKFGEDTKHFCSGAELYDLHPLSNDWNLLFGSTIDVMKAGATIDNYKSQRNKEYIEVYGHIVQFEGYRANCVNIGLVGSEVFNSLKNLEPVQIMYSYDGKVYHVSLRSTEVDVAELAAKHSGGGHKGAAGFTCEQIPWKVIE